jgi:hypothetical protein
MLQTFGGERGGLVTEVSFSDLSDIGAPSGLIGKLVAGSTLALLDHSTKPPTLILIESPSNGGATNVYSVPGGISNPAMHEQTIAEQGSDGAIANLGIGNTFHLSINLYPDHPDQTAILSIKTF